MTVYVDDVRIKASVGRYTDRSWCHLLTDDPTMVELHALAQRIGLRRAWYQPPKMYRLGMPVCWWRGHYDVTEAKRREAVRAGAVEIGMSEWSEMVQRFKQEHDAAPAVGVQTAEEQR